MVGNLREIIESRNIELDVVSAFFGHLEGDGPAHEVPREKLVDEAITVGVAQHRAVAAEGF